MDLFSDNQITNLLPFDGTVLYYGAVMAQTEANHYFNELYNNIEWKNDEAVVFGKHIITNRKVGWYGDKEFDYTYSNTTKKALAWTKELLELKKLTEEKNGAIASFTFGAERKFAFKHKQTKNTTSLILEHGSLLVMKDETQTHWMHRLPPSTIIKRPRINLTFRTIVE